MLYHWQVELPRDGSFSRTHLWAALKQTLSKIHTFLSSTEGFFSDPRSPTAALTEDEERSIRAATAKLGEAADLLDPNVLDRMAKIVDNDASSKAAEANLPEEVFKVVDAYYGDVYTFTSQHEEGDNLTLTFALLQRVVGIDNDDMGDVIKKVLGRPDSHGDRYCRLWTCPECEGHPRLYAVNAGHPCRRCCAWGYVFGAEPVEEYVQAERAALAREAALDAAEAEEEESVNSDRSVDA